MKGISQNNKDSKTSNQDDELFNLSKMCEENLVELDLVFNKMSLKKVSLSLSLNQLGGLCTLCFLEQVCYHGQSKVIPIIDTSYQRKKRMYLTHSLVQSFCMNTICETCFKPSITL